MTDRRRVSEPSGGTAPPVFLSSTRATAAQRPIRSRQPQELRKIFLKTGLTPSASGSAYLELALPGIVASPEKHDDLSQPRPSALKLTCTVHGPRPLPRSAAFAPSMVVSTHVKFAPFATRQRRGYVRDASERDLAVHLETALRGVILTERWPKSGVDVIITVLEGEQDAWRTAGLGASSAAAAATGMMSILAGCITVASTALVEAGIDCVDIVTGGVAALVRQPFLSSSSKGRPLSASDYTVVLDPSASEHEDIAATCVVGYLGTRDEITEVWSLGDIPAHDDEGAGPAPGQDLVVSLIDGAVAAATAARSVVVQALEESVSSLKKA